MGGAIVCIIVVALVAVLVRLAAGASDHERIHGEIARRGGTVTGITWEPFGKGWFGEKNDRIYKVSWRDAAGQGRTAWCKTSMMSGVYFSEEGVVGAGRESLAAAADRADEKSVPAWKPTAQGVEQDPSDLTRVDLEEEVKRLRRENEGLRGRG
ncbi:MAG TPA: hypothetical protein VHN77_15360 [Phycisphaerales bacterium]|nr:hypothetical protein [Phycisphaerales bacterium]